MNQEKQTRINSDIKANDILLINENGENVGSINISKALIMASEAGLDLVEVGFNKVPVCKIMDYGKWRYEQSKRQKKHKGQKQVIKEIKFRPNIGRNDMLYRAKQTDQFIKDGFKVKLCVRFRGREMEHMYNTGQNLLEKFLQMISSNYKMLGDAVAEGGNITLTLGPDNDNN